MLYIRTLILTFIFILSFSCREFENNQIDDGHNRETQSTSIDSIAIYNKVLEEIFDSNLNYAYLNDESANLLSSYLKNEIDSIAYQQKLEIIKKRILENDSLKKTVYLTKGNINHKSISITKEPFNIIFEKKEEIMEVLNAKPSSIDFSELRSSVVNFRIFVNPHNNEFIGEKLLYISDLFLSAKDELGALYYEYVCGAKCGQADIVVFRLLDSKVKILETIPVWEI